jgi:PKD repeat protein
MKSVSKFLSCIIVSLLVLVPGVLAAPTPFFVDFSSNVTSGTAPLAVQFTNLVTGDPVSGFWEIDNHTFTEMAGGIYIFNIPGLYTVALTVTDDTNTTLTERKIDYISVTSASDQTVLNFVSSGFWGSNPVIVTDRSTGMIAFLGRTSSKNILLNNSGSYTIEVSPGGITDIFNSPDYGVYTIGDAIGKNLLGVTIGGVLVLGLLGLLFGSRKK